MGGIEIPFCPIFVLFTLICKFMWYKNLPFALSLYWLFSSRWSASGVDDLPFELTSTILLLATKKKLINLKVCDMWSDSIHVLKATREFLDWFCYMITDYKKRQGLVENMINGNEDSNRYQLQRSQTPKTTSRKSEVIRKEGDPKFIPAPFGWC